jgi:hypothetical protein
VVLHLYSYSRQEFAALEEETSLIHMGFEIVTLNSLAPSKMSYHPSQTTEYLRRKNIDNPGFNTYFVRGRGRHNKYLSPLFLKGL